MTEEISVVQADTLEEPVQRYSHTLSTPSEVLLTPDQLELVELGKMFMLKEHHLILLAKMLSRLPGKRFDHYGNEAPEPAQLRVEFEPKENRISLWLEPPSVIIQPGKTGAS